MSTVRAEDRENGVRLLTLDRPPANAIEETLLTDLATALKQAREDESVRALVITGAGRFFSAGLDLVAVMRAGGASDGGRFDVFRDSLLDLFTFPAPTIAAVQGHAIAGGVIVALACDFRVGVEGDYVIGANEVAIGASFPRVALEIARLRLPHPQAAEVLLGAELHKAAEAYRLGILNELAPAPRFEESVLALASRLGAYPRQAYAHTKAALLRPAVERITAETPEEAAETAAVWTTPESLTAMLKQLEKLGKKTTAGPQS